MSKPLRFIDVTLRDAHQCLWSTRMTTWMMVPIAQRMDEIGFEAIDLIGGAVFDVMVRYLREDPFERMRIMTSLIKKTPLIVHSRDHRLFTFKFFPDDVVELTMQRIAANGIRYKTIYDALNDMRNLEVAVRAAKKAGLYVAGGVVYTLSPVHTDEYYEGKARELLKLGVDAVFIKDASGLLTPERTRTLVPALCRAIGDVPLQLHTHCLTGLAPICHLEAVKLGIDAVHTAISPLANGASHPATEFVARHARKLGRQVGLDDAGLQAMATYFHDLAVREGKPLGEITEYDPFHYAHQMPGGMISNLKYQLSSLGISHRLDEILVEAAQVREELGYPIIVSPFAQYVMTQAVLNVMQGERYKTVPDEVRKYALGYYGQLAAPIDPNVLDRITGGEAPITVRPGDLLEPMLPRIRRERGPFASDEDLLLACFYDARETDALFRGRPIRTDPASSRSPLVTLIRELVNRPAVSEFHIEGQGFRLSHVGRA